MFSILFIYRERVKHTKLSQSKSEKYNKRYEYILKASSYIKLRRIKICLNFHIFLCLSEILIRFIRCVCLVNLLYLIKCIQIPQQINERVPRHFLKSRLYVRIVMCKQVNLFHAQYSFSRSQRKNFGVRRTTLRP